MPKFITRREAKSRRIKFQVFAGLFDFLGIVAGLLVIAACVILLSSLYSWITGDGTVAFGTLIEMMSDAVIMPE